MNPAAPTVRLTSLDAFRGIVMLLLIPNAFEGWAMDTMRERLPDNPVVVFLQTQLSHAAWTGCHLWDLIMPSFLFIAGVSLAYSRAARVHDGATFRQAFVHSLLRAAILMVLGLFLMITVEANIDLLWPLLLLALGLPLGKWLGRLLGRGESFPAKTVDNVLAVTVLTASIAWLWINSRRSNWAFHDVLPQLALAYVPAFLIAGRSLRAQILTVVAILVGYWLAFALYPLPPADLNPASVGIVPGDEVFTGLFAHWNKGTNIAAHFDAWFLNVMPRYEPFVFNSHGYVTLNFIPSTASVMLGVITGDLMRRGGDPRLIRNRLLWTGVAALVGGWVLGQTLCPLVKSIWTPSWVIFSTGWSLLFFAAFYHACEVRSRTRWALPLVVAGLNPITLYVFSRYFRYWILEVWRRPTQGVLFDGVWAPVAEAAAVMISLWLMAYVMYRLRIFVRI